MMELDLEQQKQEFLTICHENIHREGLEELLGWLQKSDFFSAPASTRYHGAYAGGCVSTPSMSTSMPCALHLSMMENSSRRVWRLERFFTMYVK